MPIPLAERAALDSAIRQGPLDTSITLTHPAIEQLARERFLAETRGLTGKQWEWDKAGVEVRMKYRLRAALAEIDCLSTSQRSTA